MQKNILLIEDDKEIAALVQNVLEREAMKVTVEYNPARIMDIVYKNSYDLIILDLVIPDLDGLQLFHFLKNEPQTQSIPILILSGRKSQEDIILGLELGADDYITKPFEPPILLSRVQNIIRRSKAHLAEDKNIIRYEKFKLDLRRFEFRIEDKVISITPGEFRILQLLCSNPGWVFSRKQILVAMHGSERPVTMRSVDVMVLNLRQKLVPKDHLLETVRGVGYRMKEVETRSFSKAI